ncbi:hypothetical protein CRX72_21915 [Pantoea sp. BRM17]|nr:hypothetical protein CRX72_21915 [Pantoea sp. BRM17]
MNIKNKVMTAPKEDSPSAGLGALEGYPADKMASEVAAEHGLSLDGHQAQQLTAEMCRDFDLILVMEKRHIEQVNRIDPAARRNRVISGLLPTIVGIDDASSSALRFRNWSN